MRISVANQLTKLPSENSLFSNLMLRWLFTPPPTYLMGQTGNGGGEDREARGVKSYMMRACIGNEKKNSWRK